MFKKGQTVICIDDTNVQTVTKGRRYKIRSKDMYRVTLYGVMKISDPSQYSLLRATRFKAIDYEEEILRLNEKIMDLSEQLDTQSLRHSTLKNMYSYSTHINGSLAEAMIDRKIERES